MAFVFWSGVAIALVVTPLIVIGVISWTVLN